MGRIQSCNAPNLASATDYPPSLPRLFANAFYWEPYGVTLQVRFYEGGGRKPAATRQTRVSAVYGGPEDRAFTRGGPARRDGERGVPASQPIALGAVSMAGGSPGRLGGGAEARCAAKAA